MLYVGYWNIIYNQELKMNTQGPFLQVNGEYMFSWENNYLNIIVSKLNKYNFRIIIYYKLSS